MIGGIAKRHQTVLATYKRDSEIMFWVKTAIFGLMVFALCLGYVYFQTNKYEIFQINQAAAGVGTLLISFSLILSSLSYFFDLFDRLIIYRKHLGVIGYAYILAHIVSVVFLMPRIFMWSDWLTVRLTPFIFGALATVIFSIMTAISNKYAVTTLGGATWRGVLRYGGFAALIFSLLHIWFSTSRYWNLTSMWSLSLIVFCFGCLTLCIRLLMKVSMTLKRV